MRYPQIEDLSFPSDYSLKREGMTQSMLSNWQKCRRAFLIALNRWTDPEKGKRTGFGSLFHQLLDNTYTYYKKTGKAPDRKIIKDWIREYAKEETEKAGKGSLSGKKELEIERDKLVAQILMEEYIEHYAKDFELKKFDEVEQSFCVKFHGYILRGKIDARFWLHRKERWIMEHKTKTQVNVQNLFYKLSFDLQNLFYILADELENGTKVTGVLYNVVRNPSDPWKKKYPTLKEYGRVLRVKIKKDPSHYFMRWEVPYTEKDKRAFRKSLLMKLRDVRRLLSGKDYPYPNEGSCIGQWTCDYLRACSAKNLVGYVQKPKLMEELEVVEASN